MEDILKISAFILVSLGSSGAIILGLANWQGKVWANRILESERAKNRTELEREKSTHKSELERIKADLQLELEYLSRKRDIYTKLAVNMRVFLTSHQMEKTDRRENFLEAYDEAYLWASQDVVEKLGQFIDLIKVSTANPGSVPEDVKQHLYAECLHAMRIDAGHEESSQCYRIASF